MINHSVRAPRRFSITLVGNTMAVGSRHRIAPGNLPYLITRLLTGDSVAVDALEAFGLQVWIECDPDALPVSAPAESDASSA